VVEKVRQGNAGKLPNRKVRFFSTDKTLKPTTILVNRIFWRSVEWYARAHVHTANYSHITGRVLIGNSLWPVLSPRLWPNMWVGAACPRQVCRDHANQSPV